MSRCTDSRANFYFVVYAEFSLKNCAAEDASGQLLRMSTRLVYVERAHNMHSRGFFWITFWCGNSLFQGLEQDVNIDAVLSRNWNYGRFFCYRALYKLFYLFVAFESFFFIYEVDFVLDNYKIAYSNNFDSCKMLSGLRLRASFICCYDQQCSVHYRGAGKHCSHKRFMTWRINKTHSSNEFCW